MGYETNYCFSCDVSAAAQKLNPNIVYEIADELEKMHIFDEIEPYGGYVSAFVPCEKWYEHEEDMAILSKKFPDVLFTLHGEGEDRDDMWDKHFRNGMMQECCADIVYPDFDETKLEPVELDPDQHGYSYEE